MCVGGLLMLLLFVVVLLIVVAVLVAVVEMVVLVIVCVSWSVRCVNCRTDVVPPPSIHLLTPLHSLLCHHHYHKAPHGHSLFLH